jgi:DnaJ-class molecular chaperone
LAKPLINYQKNYYSILGIPITANTYQVKTAYRNLAKKHHPDKQDSKATKSNQFMEITEAYQVLSHPPTKLIYDRVRNARASTSPYAFQQTVNASFKEENTPSKQPNLAPESTYPIWIKPLLLIVISVIVAYLIIRFGV